MKNNDTKQSSAPRIKPLPASPSGQELYDFLRPARPASEKQSDAIEDQEAS